MANSTALSMDALVNFDASTLTGSYQIINGSGTEEAAIAFKFYNSSSSLILISYDGTNNHDFCPPGGTFIFDSQSNGGGYQGMVQIKRLPKGQQVWAKTSSNTDRLIMAVYR